MELKLSAGVVPPELLPALALLQRWCGGVPPSFVQLTRAQRRDLATAAGPHSP